MQKILISRYGVFGNLQTGVREGNATEKWFVCLNMYGMTKDENIGMSVRYFQRYVGVKRF